MSIVFLGIDLAKCFPALRVKPGRQTGLYEAHWPK